MTWQICEHHAGVGELKGLGFQMSGGNVLCDIDAVL